MMTLYTRRHTGDIEFSGSSSESRELEKGVAQPITAVAPTQETKVEAEIMTTAAMVPEMVHYRRDIIQ